MPEGRGVGGWGQGRAQLAGVPRPGRGSGDGQRDVQPPRPRCVYQAIDAVPAVDAPLRFDGRPLDTLPQPGQSGGVGRVQLPRQRRVVQGEQIDVRAQAR